MIEKGNMEPRSAKLVHNLCLIQVNFCQATNVSVVAGIDILIGYMNVLHKANTAISVVGYTTLKLCVG